jgi:type I restriction enzyme S subunit
LPYAFFERTAGGAVRDITDELPFEIPENWEWVRLGSVCNITRGGSPRPIQEFLTDANDGINWIKIGDTEKDGKYINSTKEKIKPEGVSKSRFVRSGDFLLTNSMSFGRPYILNVDGCIHDGWLVLSDYQSVLDVDYFYHCLSSRFAYYQFCGQVSGAVVKNLNSDKVAESLFPLPPLSEQKRIVARIEELLPHIADYDITEQKLTALNATFPDQLKKSILQSAVLGKLVPQDPADEPASALLERIRAEKEAQIKAGKIKRDKHESVIFRRDNSHYEKLDGIERCIDDEIPFDVPENWAWTRLGSIGTFIRGSGIKRTETQSTGVPCVRYGEIYTTYNISMTGAVSFVDDVLAEQSKPIVLGDLLLTLTGENKEEIGKTVAFMGNERTVIGGDLATFTNHRQNPMYLSYLMNSPYAIQQKALLGTGDIIVHISCDKLSSIFAPLPPFAEQRRIVERIEQLTAITKKL